MPVGAPLTGLQRVHRVVARDRLGIVACAKGRSAVSSSFRLPHPRHAAPAWAVFCTLLVDFRTEDHDTMCKTLRVRWTLTPTTAPQPWIACSGCGGLRPFRCSGKIRLNANGRRLDAWLIYKCVTCEKTWNRAVFERRNVRDIDPAVLDALQSNDPGWIRAEAFNLEALRRKAHRIEEFSDCAIDKEILEEPPGWTGLRIELSAPSPVDLRLDRLIAAELKIARARLRTLHEEGRLRTEPGGMLRRRIVTGTNVTLDLSAEDGMEQAWRALATGDPA
tara:strand:+ start:6698 stop:7528 length:831 start_codon:yes stop_codon:yes gene_type:complete